MERHSSIEALGLPHDEPAESRAPTKPLPPLLAGKIEVDLTDPESAAEFLELAARVLRAKRRIIIIVS